MQPNQGIEAINPLRMVGEAQYTAVWQKLFVTLLAGFWARFLFIVFVLMAVFFGLRRRDFRTAFVLAIFASLVAFGSGLLRLFTGA